MNLRIHTPFYVFFLNLDYVGARSLRSLRSNKLSSNSLRTSCLDTENINEVSVQ